MTATTPTTTTAQDILALPRDLGDGLVLRESTVADTEAVSDFDAQIFQERDTGEPAEWARWWTRDMMTTNPAVGPGNVLLIEDRRAGRIASAIHLIPQTWTYDGIPLGVGRPELVGTHPDYRRRGLVRELFRVFHARSAARGDLMQGITGIPWYYRQFGYEMCLSLEGGRRVAPTDVPALKHGDAEPYTLRPATEADLPLMQAADAHTNRDDLFAAVRDDAYWRYFLTGMSDAAAPSRRVRVVADAAGRSVGFVAHMGQVFKSNGSLFMYRFALVPGVSWPTVVPSVLRALSDTAREYAARDGREWTALVCETGEPHPAFTATPSLFSRRIPPFAWFIRVPDVAAFLNHVAPALERRLAASDCAGHTGNLWLSFYRSGVRLTLVEGKITAEATADPEGRDANPDASFPDLTFLQLLCGHRTLAELEYAFADVRVRSDATRALLDALFPKQPSNVWPIT